jgi:hypothetical protein
MGKPKWFTAWLCAFLLHLAASSFSITGVQVSLERAPESLAESKTNVCVPVR